MQISIATAIARLRDEVEIVKPHPLGVFLLAIIASSAKID